MTTIMKVSSRNLASIRRRSLVKGGMAGILATGLAPLVARAEAKKLVMAHLNAVPESAAVAFDAVPFTPLYLLDDEFAADALVGPGLRQRAHREHR